MDMTWHTWDGKARNFTCESLRVTALSFQLFGLGSCISDMAMENHPFQLKIWKLAFFPWQVVQFTGVNGEMGPLLKCLPSASTSHELPSKALKSCKGRINHLTLGQFVTVCYWKWPLKQWIYLLKMVIFHSYVSLSEGAIFAEDHCWWFSNALHNFLLHFPGHLAHNTIMYEYTA